MRNVNCKMIGDEDYTMKQKLESYLSTRLLFVNLLFMVNTSFVYAQGGLFNPDTELEQQKNRATIKKNVLPPNKKDVPEDVPNNNERINNQRNVNQTRNTRSYQFFPSDPNAKPTLINNLFLGVRGNIVLGYGNDVYTPSIVRPSVYIRLEYLFHKHFSFFIDFGYKQNTLSVQDTMLTNSKPVEWFSDYIDLQFLFSYQFYLYDIFKWRFIKYFKTIFIIGTFVKFPTTSSIFFETLRQTLDVKSFQPVAIPGIVIGFEWQVSYHILRYLFIGVYYLRTFTNLLNSFNATEISLSRIVLSEFQIGLGIKYPIARIKMIKSKKGV